MATPFARPLRPKMPTIKVNLILLFREEPFNKEVQVFTSQNWSVKMRGLEMRMKL
jgi:hypothetical protein